MIHRMSEAVGRPFVLMYRSMKGLPAASAEEFRLIETNLVGFRWVSLAYPNKIPILSDSVYYLPKCTFALLMHRSLASSAKASHFSLATA